MDNKDMVLAARHAQLENYPVKLERIQRTYSIGLNHVALVDHKKYGYIINERKGGVWVQTISDIPIK